MKNVVRISVPIQVCPRPDDRPHIAHLWNMLPSWEQTDRFYLPTENLRWCTGIKRGVK